VPAPLTSRYLPPGGWSQRNQRTETDFTDQHGRMYHATIETKTGDPCGLIEPLYTAPLMVPQQYLKRVPRQPYTLNIDYTAWKADVRGGWADWQKAGRDHARKLHGDAYDPRRPFTEEILSIIGPPPQAIDPIIAAEQGNKWVLGLTTRVDLRLAKFFEPEQLDPDYRTPPEEDYRDLEVDEMEEENARRQASPTAEKTERNAAVMAALEEGQPVIKVAKQFGISESRVREIRKQEAKRLEALTS
jgi:hypothetical protein